MTFNFFAGYVCVLNKWIFPIANSYIYSVLSSSIIAAKYLSMIKKNVVHNKDGKGNAPWNFFLCGQACR
jgi:hypothetical protein